MRRYTFDHGEFRNGNKYRKSNSHVKKQPSDIKSTKKAWRDHKGINKDKKKSGRFYRSRSWKKSSIKNGRGSYRRWVKDNIINQNYDIFHDRDDRMFINTWDWT